MDNNPETELEEYLRILGEVKEVLKKASPRVLYLVLTHFGMVLKVTPLPDHLAEDVADLRKEAIRPRLVGDPEDE